MSLPDGWEGKNTSYTMADFALAAFAPFFMQSPSFLAHQRHLETAQYQLFDSVYLGGDLFSRQPICEAVLAAGGHFVFVRKLDSHPVIADFRAGIKPVTLTEQVWRGKKRTTYRYRWLNGVPLRGAVNGEKAPRRVGGMCRVIFGTAEHGRR